MDVSSLNLAGAEHCIVHARKMACPGNVLSQDSLGPYEPFPILENVRIEVINGKIHEIDRASCRYDNVQEVVDFGDVILLPGLVNAHTHLQLSWLHPLVKMDQGFVPWLQSLVPPLLKVKTTGYETASVDMTRALQDAFKMLVQSGTAMAGDVGSTLPGAPSKIDRLADQHSLHIKHFCEWFGFVQDKILPWPKTCHDELENASFKERAAPAGHALYSTEATLLRDLKKWCKRNKRIFSIHIAESMEETDLLANGKGTLHEYYRGLVLPEDWTAPEERPVPLAVKLGLLDEQSLAVHCVQLEDEDIGLLKDSGCSVCLCPRSNMRLGVGKAPVRKLLDAGINVCLGTDGLSSNDDLDLRNEASFLMKEQDLPPYALLRMLTVNGAKALGADARDAMIMPGNRAIFSAIKPDVFF